MQESLVETHHLQAKLQTSHGSAADGMASNPGGRFASTNGGVSRFNSLVLQFSSNIESMAQELVEATESKRKNMRMKEMVAEMAELRRVRSASKSAPASARGHSRRRSLSSSKKQRSRKSLSSRSRSSRKGSTAKKSRS